MDSIDTSSNSSRTSTTPLTSSRTSPKNVISLYNSDYSPDLSWREEALCRKEKIHTSHFFAMNADNKSVLSVSHALSVCERCPVKTNCLFESIKYNYDGVWGGTVYRQRLHFIREKLDNDVNNLTMEHCSEFIQMAKIQNVRIIGKNNNRRNSKGEQLS